MFFSGVSYFHPVSLFSNLSWTTAIAQLLRATAIFAGLEFSI